MDRFETARTRSTRLYASLRADIISGRMRPGAGMSETGLAEQHGISRTPVREVLRRLTEEGLLRVVPQIGTFVAPIKLTAVKDSQFIRETLECRAVRLVVETITRDQVKALRAHLDRQGEMIAGGDTAGFFASDEAMHRDLMRMAEHPSVWDLIASVKAQLDRVRHLSLEDTEWLAMIFGQHREIVRCIDARDAVGAEQAMQTHLRTVFGAIERIAAAQGEFFEQEPKAEREFA
jgi:GntR family transcriptional regulator, rspAB operon transcriptional repressor